ncbi:unnamed protein product [Parascedosporium putredinis]|uniref:Nascent polypeptide-associated complex subunit alpha-like UBA domain-containing protein n=1 Tax=Parascedosporium putredinis TaxID=1442378 RepID=A0A9P1HBS4_9PEZI|nr:unnamed protein product [Parascedosporium putredinis]CAI8002336.1 unnamed protein product [Parascedosporium putredinis]
MSNNAQNAQNPDAEDETPVAKSAEDRKAATALANLDARDESSAAASNVDQDAVSAAMKTLGGAASGAGLGAAAKGLPARTKNVKVDQADVTLLVEELDLPKAKALDLLKAHDGDAIEAMKAHIQSYSEAYLNKI